MFIKKFGKPIKYNEFQEVAKNSVFQIEYKISKDEFEIGTGFFIKLPIPSKNKPMYGLITCNHVLNSKQLISNFEFKIILKNKKKEFKIKLNESQFIFTSKLLDITFIQFTDDLINELNLKKKDFLTSHCNDIKINDKNGNIIFVLQYPMDEEFHFAFGNIKSDYGFDYFHTGSTESGSSGSPLINNNFEVLGVHKTRREGSNENEDVNVATKFSIIEYAIRTLKQGLHEQSKLIFLLPKFDSSSDLYLCRSNHAWYFTNELNECNNDDKCNIKNIKMSKWNIIKSIYEDDDDINYNEISHQQRIIITFLKLSELIYLT
eukprot:jgi/Orpsp1_1/1175225/evm.model.c7180000053078.1